MSGGKWCVPARWLYFEGALLHVLHSAIKDLLVDFEVVDEPEGGDDGGADRLVGGFAVLDLDNAGRSTACGGQTRGLRSDQGAAAFQEDDVAPPPVVPADALPDADDPEVEGLVQPQTGDVLRERRRSESSRSRPPRSRR
jgi:hypothetical protein